MAERWYELLFKPLQPLHIGTGNYGVVSPTRLFIPGQTMQGALICALGNYLKKAETEMKEKCDIFSKISNFYPVITDNYNNEICLPAYKQAELYFGKFSEKEFRYRFIKSIISTSIQSDNRAAKENSLHEIEYLLTADKTNPQTQLSFKGILNLDLQANLLAENGKKYNDFFKNNLKIVVGGERKYGFGLMILNEIKQLADVNSKQWNLENNSGENKFSIAAETPIVHFVNDYGQRKIIKGEIETGFEISKSSENNIILQKLGKLYIPGCECGEQITFSISSGILR